MNAAEITARAAYVALYRTRLMLAEVWRDRHDTRFYPLHRRYVLARVRLARSAIAQQSPKKERP